MFWLWWDRLMVLMWPVTFLCLKVFAEKAGMEGKAADNFAKTIMNSAENFKNAIAQGITGVAASMAGTKQEAKTRSDLDSISEAKGRSGYVEMASAFAKAKTGADLKKLETYDSVEDFVTSAKTSAGKQEIISKIQNLDLSSPEKSSKFMKDLLSHQSILKQSPEKRDAVIEELIGRDMLEEGSSFKDFKATSGEKFAIGRASLSAGSMDKSDRFVLGDFAYNLTQSVSKGGLPLLML